MQRITHTDPMTSRKYEALQDGDQIIKIGPPEGLVDELNLPEPFATDLHNALHRRRIFTFKEASRNGALQGALQEALNLSAQRLTDTFANYEKEEVADHA